ncbi:MAG: hypothetical protein M3Q07_19075 [Pseudobdellovibrionaceae bacterium]|nr:hypothetical protein [Pseudobdellovibrionaceae bacterium]
MIQVRTKHPELTPIRDGIAFEVIRALTRTARDAAGQIKREMPGKFILRRDWVLKGIRFDAASRGNPVAQAYSIDPYMTKQEEGEEYSPAGTHVAIPAGVRKSKTDGIPLSMFPRMLKGRQDIFKAEVQRRGGWGIFQKEKEAIKLLYLLRRRKTTKPRWDFLVTVGETIERRFHKNLK